MRRVLLDGWDALILCNLAFLVGLVAGSQWALRHQALDDPCREVTASAIRCQGTLEDYRQRLAELVVACHYGRGQATPDGGI